MSSACTYWLLAYGEAAVKNGVINVSLYRAELRPVLRAGDNERNSIRANEITVTLQWSLSVLPSLLPSQTSQSAAFPETQDWQDVLYIRVHVYEWHGCSHYSTFWTYSLTLSHAVVHTVWVCFCTTHQYTPIPIKTNASYLQHHMLGRARLINHF